MRTRTGWEWDVTSASSGISESTDEKGHQQTTTFPTDSPSQCHRHHTVSKFRIERLRFDLKLRSGRRGYTILTVALGYWGFCESVAHCENCGSVVLGSGDSPPRMRKALPFVSESRGYILPLTLLLHCRPQSTCFQSLLLYNSLSLSTFSPFPSLLTHYFQVSADKHYTASLSCQKLTHSIFAPSLFSVARP
ncbi:hypothetical protein BDR07DRAFT_1013712 [Suillus spraguei]|nr:hypothetical protein BDR07DRAFT_1013712 [Suillus spraguei]